MKSIRKLIIAIGVGVSLLTSCQKLDIKPTNILTDDVIFGGEGGVNSYLADVYRKLPIEDFTYRPTGRDGRWGFNLHHEWEHFWNAGSATGEMVGPYGGMDIGGGCAYWPYSDIRAVNYLIETLPKYSANFTGNRVNEILGEAYFLRAYYYFALAKRYGGVPIITSVQNYPEQSIEELQVHRSKEDEVWEFIGKDLDQAYSMMPETSLRARANKYVAAALKSRAMLYAGSIAKYGSVNFVDGDAKAQGYVGIPADKAAAYFQQAWDAAKLLDGHYSLYQKNPDKELNYADLFLDHDSPENILVRDYSITSNTAHSWDATFSPRFMTADALSRAYPTLEFVQRFVQLPVTNADGTPRRFDNLADLKQGLEPRLLATVYFPGATLRGRQFDMQRGIYPTFSGTAAAEVAKQPDQRNRIVASDPNTLYQGLPVIGQTGIRPPGSSDEVSRTGFYVRKYIDYKKPQNECGLFQSTQSWIEFRYAEILLNRAEAATELGKADDALFCLNQLRSRAGATVMSMADVTIDNVRNERCKELAFENHYWWDIRRWRIADQLLDNARFRGLMPYYVLNEKKYIFLNEPEVFERNYFFDKKFYYEPIPGGELGKNPNLYPNNPNY
ncbi:RagB/SusD family nutrient uptake outer membrane protein [Pedobacter sp. HMF7647]|uniref:RagB/SusD family nutrient uptake outer membrane protein n=1 Tax=Hufsiella arboris TaxID=2695275 RepID=A0A7K1YEU4_9SPHI|nr:RagB/SusD family nutrient uptake outer membrane protein [Hufsiella arboris]MXV52911.1 RagB/SusD family nutrient uptake outer membrane protein [Hufsiella arboris]